MTRARPRGGARPMSRGRRLAHRAIYVCFAAAMLACLNGCGLFGPPQPIFTARGRVVDLEGRVVPGAVVTDGQESVLSDEGGRFALAVYDRLLSAAKPGFKAARIEAAEGAETSIALEPTARRPRVALDGRWAGKALTGLRTALAEAGEVAPYPGTALSRLDVLLMVTPGAVASAERAAIASWVRGGGRLVLCAEWGGFPEQDLGTLNDLAGPAGLAFPGGTVRQLDDADLTLRVARATPGSLGARVGEDPITLYAASDVKLSGAARAVLASGARSYAVLAADAAPVLAGVGPAGLGKVFAIGDSSLWRDEDSEGRGVPNLAHGGNARLVAALLGW